MFECMQYQHGLMVLNRSTTFGMIVEVTNVGKKSMQAPDCYSGEVRRRYARTGAIVSLFNSPDWGFTRMLACFFASWHDNIRSNASYGMLDFSPRITQ